MLGLDPLPTGGWGYQGGVRGQSLEAAPLQPPSGVAGGSPGRRQEEPEGCAHPLAVRPGREGSCSSPTRSVHRRPHTHKDPPLEEVPSCGVSGRVEWDGAWGAQECWAARGAPSTGSEQDGGAGAAGAMGKRRPGASAVGPATQQAGSRKGAPRPLVIVTHSFWATVSTSNAAQQLLDANSVGNGDHWLCGPQGLPASLLGGGMKDPMWVFPGPAG